MEDLLGMGTVSDQIACSKSDSDTISIIVLELYLVVGMILLLNMLIAMMGETFNEVRARQEEEYNFLNSQIVISLDMDAGNIPPPLSFLRAPAKLLGDFAKLAKGMYETLEEKPKDTDYKTFTHVSAEELMSFLDEADQQSEKEDLPGLILGAKQAILDELGASLPEIKGLLDKAGAAKALEEAAKTKEPSADDVIVFDGYHEEASRLCFHYGDHFMGLSAAPDLRTYLPSGLSENEPKKAPIYIHDEAPTSPDCG